jgi:hypothetical protein
MQDILTQKAPFLPLAPESYAARYQEQFNNVLRLYFNQVDSNDRAFYDAVNSTQTMMWLGGFGGGC